VEQAVGGAAVTVAALAGDGGLGGVEDLHEQLRRCGDGSRAVQPPHARPPFRAAVGRVPGFAAQGGDAMAADVWVGLDLGTQSVRALAVTADGTVAGTGSRPLRGRRDGPRHEQDPDDWWRAVATACREALRDVDPAAVRGVAVDATSGTVLLVDREGTPLTPGLMYDDTRAAAEVDRVNEVGAAVWRELGYQRMQPAWALPKLLWLLREHPAEPGTRLAHQSDLVTSRLVGGPVAADLSNALKTGAHLIDETWPADVFDALGVPAESLPPLVRPGTQIGVVGAAAAQESGLPAGTPVVAG